MTREWIERKADEMINKSSDPDVQEAGRMLQAALRDEDYNNQTLSDNMIETRLYRVQPEDRNKPEGKWSGSWERDPTKSGLENDDANNDWNGSSTDENN